MEMKYLIVTYQQHEMIIIVVIVIIIFHNCFSLEILFLYITSPTTPLIPIGSLMRAIV
jgi:hypothetical protein